ncbi:chaplin family protein [Streptomyces sp. NPDC048106]|uniref:chaplin n=1 Tax=Streptomyces sp. NPDC048106 TaxID=3155750 RepID=UPI00345523C7
MRQTLSKGMVVAAAAATGVLSLYGTAALADSNAQATAKGSPSVLTANSTHAPGRALANGCGSSVDAAAVPNLAFGTSCARVSGTPTATPTPTSHSEDSYGEDSYGDDSYGDDSYGDDEPTPSSYGKPEPTRSSYGHDEPKPTPSSYGHEEPKPSSYGKPEPKPTHTSYGSDEPTSSYGSEKPTPTSYGSDEPTKPSSYGSDEPKPPSYGNDEPTPPGSYGNDEPPSLPHTGGNAKAMMATTAASAALIMAGAVLFRRGRTAARR